MKGVAESRLTELLQQVIASRYKSAENLAVQTGLAHGTVRNILRTGRASQATLERLGKELGRSPLELQQLMLDQEPSGDLTPFERDVLAVARLVPEQERQAFLVGIQALAQGLRELDSR